MALSLSHRLAPFSVLLAGWLSAPQAQAQWGSIHGNNRTLTVPQRPAFTPATPQPVQPHTERAAPSVRQQQPSREQHPPAPRAEVNRGRQEEHGHQKPEETARAWEPQRDRGRNQEWESARRRGDFDEDRRDSFYWSRFHRGMVVNILPPGYFEFSWGGIPYYYYGGVYYAPQPNGYQVVPAPLGVTVSLLPADAQPIVVNNTTYYQVYGVYYLPVMQNGVTVFLTVQPP